MKTALLVSAVMAAAVLTACGKNEPAAPDTSPAPAAQPATAAAPVAENTIGKGVYAKTCAMCHAAGVAGAPKPGDEADWGPRRAQGNDVLYRHAIEGYNGSKGMMPARGGSTALSDDEVKAAVDYMASFKR